MKKSIFYFCITGFLLISPARPFAQKMDSLLAVYNDTHQAEKIHIHFDRSVYNKGDTIWIKLYLLAGADFSEYSKNIYIDWFTVNGTLLQHASAPLIQSTARMQFAIPVSYEGALLHAVAYTRWMLNADTGFLFKKDIPVAQVTKPASPAPISHLHFFPEGGTLVNGLSAYVAFKANDQWGNPVKISGVVKTGSGAFVDSIITVHDGMGSFSLEPKKEETYIAYWTDETGVPRETPLPAAKASGVNLEIQPLQGKTLFQVKRTEDVSETSKLLHLVVTMNQQLYYHFRLNLSAKTATPFSPIPTAGLPTGVLTITLLDSNWLPLAERVVFVNNHQYAFHPLVSFPEKSLSKRGKNTIQIEMPDTLAANFSVAVTDAGDISDSSNTILSQFLLCSEIKGQVYNPAYYFSSEEDSVAQQLDLVMLTHGWRRYRWDEIASGKIAQPLYRRETDYLLIKGQMTGEGNEKMAAKPAFNIILSEKDSTKEVLSVTPGSDGSFAYNKGLFYDTVQIQYQMTGNKKTKSSIALHFENSLLPGLSVTPDFFEPAGGSANDSSRQAMMRMMLEEHERVQKLKASATLQEVVVKTKAKTRVDILDEKYAKGPFSGGNAYKLDIVNDLIAQTTPDILSYLQGRAPGLRYGRVANSGYLLTWRGSITNLYVNEIKADVPTVLNLSMQDIAYIKIFPPIFYGSASDGKGGAVSIYLRDGAEAAISSTNETAMPKAYVAGYTPYKEFYSPDYSAPQPSAPYPDTRTTLYWNPYILTDATHKSIQLPFYNNDHSKKLRVIIEGVNANRQLTRVEKIIE